MPHTGALELTTPASLSGNRIIIHEDKWSTDGTLLHGSQFAARLNVYRRRTAVGSAAASTLWPEFFDSAIPYSGLRRVFR